MTCVCDTHQLVLVMLGAKDNRRSRFPKTCFQHDIQAHLASPSSPELLRYWGKAETVKHLEQ